jgi:hypothetical protein
VVKDTKGKTVEKLDLWKSTDYQWKKKISEEEFRGLDELLKFPRERVLDDLEVVSHINRGLFSWPAYIVKTSEGKFIVYFTLTESQPARYQCFVLAIVTR